MCGKAPTEAEILKAFNTYDTDGSGFIELDEMVCAVAALCNFTKEEAEHIAKKIIEEDDENGDGKISYEEFKAGVEKEVAAK